MVGRNIEPVTLRGEVQRIIRVVTLGIPSPFRRISLQRRRIHSGPASQAPTDTLCPLYPLRNLAAWLQDPAVQSLHAQNLCHIRPDVLRVPPGSDLAQ